MSLPSGVITLGVLAFVSYAAMVELFYLAFDLADFADNADPVATFFPPAGLTLVLFLGSRYSRWPVLVVAIWTAEVAMDVAHGVHLWDSAVFAVANTVEPMISAVLVRRLIRSVDRGVLISMRNLMVFLGAAVLAGPCVGALIGASVTAPAPGFATFTELWVRWWVGDGIGVLVVAPLLLVLGGRGRAPRPWGVPLLVLVAVTAAVALGPVELGDQDTLVYLLLPVLVWVATRGRPGTTAAAVLMVGLAANLATVLGYGPFAASSNVLSGLLNAQIFIGTLVFSALTVAVLIAELVQRNEREALLRDEAFNDPLTGLVNRRQFRRLGQAAIEDAGHPHPVIVMFLDLDRFKLVNDSLAHAMGDALLKKVADRLNRELRGGDVLARQGGDEFVVLLRDASHAEAQAIAERMRGVVAEPFDVDAHHLTTTVSIGLATSDPGASVETLLRDADVALYRAKDLGGNTVAWFDPEGHHQLLERIAMESDLRKALATGALELHFQPSFALTDDHLHGVEALARWIHPERGAVPPDVFIPVAEESGLIRPLGRYVLETACRQAAQWTHVPDFTVWVNASGRELTPGYAESVLELLEREELPTHRMGIEVTESTLADETVAVHELRLLHTAGVAVAIDDFGTGYSSLARLAALPISLLKIDRSFVDDLSTPFGRAAVDVIVQLAGVLGVETVAEGVETRAQLEILREAGVGSASGYLLGRPTGASSLTAALDGEVAPV